MADRDNNGMTAVDWKSANVAIIQSKTLKDSKNNIELFDRIKDIISDAVNLIRGSAKKDDKYRNIVDLIMMRVRAALSNAVSDLQDSTDIDKVSDDLISSLQEKCAELVSKNNEATNDNSESADTAIHVNAKEISDNIIAAITECLSKNTSSSNKAESEETELSIKTEKPAVVSTDDDGASYQAVIDTIQDQFNSLEQTITDNITQLVEKFKNVTLAVQKSSTAVTRSSDNIQYEQYTEACINVLHDEFTKLDNLITTSLATFNVNASSQTKPVDYDYYEKYICECIDKLEKASAGAGGNGSAAGGKPESAKIIQKRLLSVKKYIDENFNIVASKLDSNAFAIKEHIDQENKLLNQIIERQKKGSFSLTSILLILGLVGGVLVTMFWPQIKGFLDKIDFGKYFSEIIGGVGKLWDNIYPYISPVLASIGTTISDFFTSLITAPVDYVVDKFKRLFDAMTEFKDDIWGWITGKSKETAKEQDKKEKDAEANVVSKLNNNLEATDKMLTDSNKNIDSKIQANETSLDNTISTTESQVNDQTDKLNKKVEGDVQEIQTSTDTAVQNVTQNVESTSKEVQNTTDNMQNTVLPNATADLEKQTSGNINNLDGKLNDQIVKAEKSADEKIAEAEKKAEAEGKPTDITTENLNKMNAAADGADLSGDIEKKPQGPSEVEQVTIEQQNKTQTLYSNKEDAARIKADQAALEGIDPNDAGKGQDGVNPDPNSVSGKLVVKADTPNIKAATPQEVRDIVHHAESIEQIFKAGNRMLETVISNVHEYFKDLNKCIDTLAKQTPPSSSESSTTENTQQNNTVVIASSPAEGGNLIAADNK